MKKAKKLFLLLIPLLLLTGCAPTLKCSVKTSNYESKIKIKFKDDKPTTYNYEDKMDFGNTLEADSELYYDSKLTKYNDLVADKHGKVSNFQNVVKVKINYDFSKYNVTNDEKALLITRNDSLGVAKQKIESSGYKCK